jgi:hypothetical protein
MAARHPRRAAHPSLWIVALACVLCGFPRGAPAQLPAGTIAFLHEDAGTTDPLRQIFNLRLLDAEDPARQMALTAFGLAPSLVQDVAWSRDRSTIAFSANVNGGLRSLEEQSVFAIGGDGTSLRQLTGFGLLADLPGPTGTVTGTVAPPALALGSGTVPGRVNACVVSAQGSSRTASCESDGSFRLQGVPVGSGWVRAQADVDYVDIGLGLFDGPGLSIGFAPVKARAGQAVNVGTIRIDPQVAKSIQPAWSPDGRSFVATSAVRAMVLRRNPDTYALEWVPTRGNALAIWDLAGGAGPRTVPLPGTADLADLSGADWGPDGRLACAATGTIGGRGGSFVLVIGADGSGAQLVYQARVGIFEPAVRIVLMARWSPDGRRLAVVEGATSVYNPSVGWSDVVVMNADGGDARPLTNSKPGEYAGAPSWSPDGSALAYHVAVMPSLLTMVIDRSDVFAVRADGSGLVRLTTDGRSSQPAWRAGGFPPPPTTTTTTTPGGSTTTTLPRPCGGDGECDDANPCTVDTCPAGFCLSVPIGGFAGARCATDRLTSELCASGEMDRAFTRFLPKRAAAAAKSLAAAEATMRAARQAKLLRTADRKLKSIADRARAAAKRKRRPMAVPCADRIRLAVEAARQAIVPLR